MRLPPLSICEQSELSYFMHINPEGDLAKRMTKRNVTICRASQVNDVVVPFHYNKETVVVNYCQKSERLYSVRNWTNPHNVSSQQDGALDHITHVIRSVLDRIFLVHELETGSNWLTSNVNRRNLTGILLWRLVKSPLYGISEPNVLQPKRSMTTEIKTFGQEIPNNV